MAGRYTLQETIAALPVGALWRARDAEGGGTVDVLLVDGAVFPSPLDQERARREMRQLQKIDCPSLLKLLDHGKHDGQLFVVTEAASGKTLAEVLAAGPVGLEEAQRYVREIGTALAEAQKTGVIHRDVAPHNVLVTAEGRVKVRGFGIAAPVKRHVFGTPEYLSPEQATGRPVDQRSNIYGLGALMYHMLVGAPPFTGSTEEVLEQHQKAAPPPLPKGSGHPARVEQLILKALDKSSSRRHLTLRQFLREVDALVAATAGAEVSAPKQPVSFETPLHGVTALTGGARPPTSEQPAVPRKGPAFDAAAMAAAATLPPPAEARGAGPTAPPAAALSTQPAARSVGEPMAKTMLQEPTATGRKAEQRQPSPTHPPVTPDSGAAVGGEVAGGERVSLRQADEQAAAGAQKQPTAPPPAASGQPGKPGFRETMWFFKGEMESALAEDGSAEPPPPEPETMEDLADKYQDDGSLSDEAAARLSLRTGKTQVHQAMAIPKGPLPGKAMQAEEFIDEMHRGRRTAIWIGIAIVVLAAAGIGIWLAVQFSGAK